MEGTGEKLGLLGSLVRLQSRKHFKAPEADVAVRVECWSSFVTLVYLPL